MSDVQIDLDAVNVIADVAPKQVEDVKVVFVAHEDTELRINQTVTRLAKGRPTKLSRDEARILLEAGKGYVRE